MRGFDYHTYGMGPSGFNCSRGFYGPPGFDRSPVRPNRPQGCWFAHMNRPERPREDYENYWNSHRGPGRHHSPEVHGPWRRHSPCDPHRERSPHRRHRSPGHGSDEERRCKRYEPYYAPPVGCGKRPERHGHHGYDRRPPHIGFGPHGGEGRSHDSRGPCHGPPHFNYGPHQDRRPGGHHGSCHGPPNHGFGPHEGEGRPAGPPRHCPGSPQFGTGPHNEENRPHGPPHHGHGPSDGEERPSGPPGHCHWPPHHGPEPYDGERRPYGPPGPCHGPPPGKGPKGRCCCNREKKGHSHHDPHRRQFGPSNRCPYKPTSDEESGNDTGRKNKPCSNKNKEQNRETILVQRIVVEKAPRCYSV